uniref:Uncharacterized protein n=1 Tax=Amphimedon queenslandica TaxID=400682 RepID=A0A1X7SMF2_AMPQE
MPPPKVVHNKRSKAIDGKDDGCPKKLPVVNNSGNNNNDGNNNGQSANCLIDEGKSGPRPSTTICYDPIKTWSNWVYNPVRIDWQRQKCQKLGLCIYAQWCET